MEIKVRKVYCQPGEKAFKPINQGITLNSERYNIIPKLFYSYKERKEKQKNDTNKHWKEGKEEKEEKRAETII